MKSAIAFSAAIATASAISIPSILRENSTAFPPSYQPPPGYPSPSAPPPSTEQERLAGVAEAFQFSWDGYYKYAFPNDELLPQTNGYSNSRNGWGASAADALSTAIVMQNKKIVNEILNYIPTINWSVSKDNEVVSLFETTIRYLAGMLSAYDLLNAEFGHLVENPKNVPLLLEQARNLANNLSFAFDTPTGIPSNNIYVGNRTTDGSTTNGLATVGTLILEWTRLSDLLKDPKYGQLAQKGESYLLSPKPAYNEPFPGLVGDTISIETGEFTTASGGWIGGSDSFYEYLIKMYVYDSARFGKEKDRWVAAADSTIKYLSSHPKTRPDLTYVAEFDNKTIVEESEHLACFDGGNFILGGLVLKEQKYLDYGLALVDACYNTYAQTLTKIGPETFGWDPTQVPAGQEAFFKRAGFYITDAAYILRPEVLESIYYAYRATGNKKYQDWSWDSFVAINSTCRLGSGFTSINNVNAPNGGGGTNFQESFWFAEVMKYTYIIHAPSAEYQVNDNGRNYFVFNTEAHPIKVAGRPI